MKNAQQELEGMDDFTVKRKGYDYFGLISLPGEIEQSINSYKERLSMEIGIKGVDFHSRAHISIAQLTFKEECDAEIMVQLKSLLDQEPSFMITLEGAGQFKHGNKSKTCFIRVADDGKLKMIYEKLRAIFPKLPVFYTPHVTVAKSMPPANADQALLFLEKIITPVSFRCDRIAVLKRKWEGSKEENYQKLGEILLK